MKFEFPSDISLEVLNRDYGAGYLPGTLDVQFVEIGKDSLKAAVQVDDRHLRPGNIVHGGVFLVLIETVGSVSACCAIDMGKFNALGIQVSASHIASAKKGDTLFAVSRAIHIGRTTHIWEVEIENQNGKLLSSGRITLLICQRT
jgi:1,4-dihydroxy-2-naphthoyl-CoA hydrolase